jgi:hypothetical protein
MNRNTKCPIFKRQVTCSTAAIVAKLDLRIWPAWKCAKKWKIRYPNMIHHLEQVSEEFPIEKYKF